MSSPPIFIGRGRLLEKARQAVDAQLDVHLCGETGVGKTAFARRISPEAVFISHCTPAGEVLCGLLWAAYNRGWWDGPKAGDLDDGDDLDEATLAKAIRKMGQKTAISHAIDAYTKAQPRAVVVFDSFDSAPPSVVRMVKELAAKITVVAITTAAKPTQKPFLFHCVEIHIPRLSTKESEELAGRLLDNHAVEPKERARLLRHLVEEAQGLPAVLHELVKRATARGDLSLRAIRGEEINGHQTIDLTPAIIIFVCALMVFRGVARGWGDHDWTVFVGATGALFVLFRFFAFRASRTRRA